MMFIQQTFKNDLPTLYLVGTPIGNLADLSFRAVEVLKSVETILCEDTRTSLVLLKKYDIKKPLLSLHKFNELERSEQISTLLAQNQNLALISDAGVPVISDPGANLTHQLRWVEQLSFNLSAVNVGPAYIHALIISGFTNLQNYFYGFLKGKNEASKLKELTTIFDQVESCSITFYESVHRIQATIATLTKVLGPETRITLNRELTKLNEEIIYGTISEVNQYVQSDQFLAKGEFVIVIDYQKQVLNYDDETLLKLIEEAIVAGLKVKEATKKVSEATKVNKNYLYELYLKQK